MAAPPTDRSVLYRLAAMGYEIIAAIVVCGGLGWLGDWLLGTWPWLLISGLGVGLVVGMLRFVRDALRANRGS